jgi:hypothetical protein
VFVAPGPRSHFGGLGSIGTGLRRVPSFAPLAVVLVAPKNFLDHGIDDLVRVALDEVGALAP